MHIGEYVKGGVATYIQEVVKYQNENKEVLDLKLILSDTNSDKNFSMNKKDIKVYPYKRNLKSIIKAMFYVNKNIREQRPDIVHVHSTFAGFFVRAPLLLQKKRYKVVYCAHGWAFCMETSNLKKKVYEIIERVLAVRTDKIINISSSEHEEALSRGLPYEKCELIHNGISKELHEGGIDYSVDTSKINLLFVGRFDQQKGLDILLKFFGSYQNHNIKLHIIGESILNNAEVEVPSNVVSIGWINHEHIDSYYKLFDAIIIPSRWEGFGLVAIEAMKNKKAIIVSNRGALPELATTSNGYVFDLNNLDTLKELLDKLSREELIAKGLNGFNEFEKKYTSKKMNAEILKLYNEIL
ncbi:glycosyltransferase family 4 protein [Bacillus pretiosus]|uniref:glycosyltransferase family 4 protein n=1 Tax=Bacillus pretiosus TaxID=2983392 RepID=UPI003D658CAA